MLDCTSPAKAHRLNHKTAQTGYFDRFFTTIDLSLALVSSLVQLPTPFAKGIRSDVKSFTKRWIGRKLFGCVVVILDIILTDPGEMCGLNDAGDSTPTGSSVLRGSLSAGA